MVRRGTALAGCSVTHLPIWEPSRGTLEGKMRNEKPRATPLGISQPPAADSQVQVYQGRARNASGPGEGLCGLADIGVLKISLNGHH